MAVRLPVFPVNPSPPSRALARRALRVFAAAAVLLAATSCSVLPPSLRGKAEPAPAPVPQAQFGPYPAGKVTTIDAGAGREAKAEAKVFKGTGNFLNPKPPAAATP